MILSDQLTGMCKLQQKSSTSNSPANVESNQTEIHLHLRPTTRSKVGKSEVLGTGRVPTNKAVRFNESHIKNGNCDSILTCYMRIYATVPGVNQA